VSFSAFACNVRAEAFAMMAAFSERDEKVVCPAG